ncbi:hypothetical protein SNE40_014450 [Patella caerulea]
MRQNFHTILETILRLQREGFINVGYRIMWKLLNVHCGVPASQRTVRLAFQTLTPELVNARARRILHRRVYTNRGSNDLIHIDGYDKSKPYGIAIHGAIDGFSRKILWLKAGPSNNNPQYIARFYLNFVKETKRIPRCVRLDDGTENGIVKDLQTAFVLSQQDSTDMPPFLRGRSTGNQRIERFWGSLRQTVCEFWRNYFREIRSSGELDQLNPIDIQCIRLCFLSVIKYQLMVFQSTWNVHRIRAQRNCQVSGIPSVLYHQPQVYGYEDRSLPLSCNIGILQEIIDEYSLEYPLYGCENDFLVILEEITGVDKHAFTLPTNVREAHELYVSLKECLNGYRI